MRTVIVITLLSLAMLAACSGGSERTDGKDRSEQELLASYLDYHKNKDLAGVLGLFYLQETPQFVIDSVKQRTLQNFKFTITSARIEEIPPDKLARVLKGAPFNDTTLIPNLKPLKQITLTFDQAGQTGDMRAASSTIMFGQVDNVCYFILSKEKGPGAR